MHCGEFQSRLEQAVELRLDPTTELRQHGETCTQPMCREAWEDWVLLAQVLPDWCRQQQKENVNPAAHRISAIRRENPRDWRRTSRVPLTLAAASLLVAFAINPLVLQLFFRAEHAAIATRQRSWPSSQFLLGHHKDAPHDLDQDGTSVPGLSESTASTSLGQAGFSIDWIAEAPLQVTSSMAYVLLGTSEPVHEPRSSGTSWLENWPEQLMPVKEDVEAIRSLWTEPQDNQTHHIGPFSGGRLG